MGRTCYADISAIIQVKFFDNGKDDLADQAMEEFENLISGDGMMYTEITAIKVMK
jgi:hypothetical protein